MQTWPSLLFFVPPSHMYRQLKRTYGLSQVGAIWRTFAADAFRVYRESACLPAATSRSERSTRRRQRRRARRPLPALGRLAFGIDDPAAGMAGSFGAAAVDRLAGDHLLDLVAATASHIRAAPWRASRAPRDVRSAACLARS